MESGFSPGRWVCKLVYLAMRYTGGSYNNEILLPDRNGGAMANRGGLLPCSRGDSGGGFTWSYETSNSRRELDFLQEDPELHPSKTVRCLECHIHLFVDGVQKLHTCDQRRWKLRSGDRLTEKFPVAKTLSFLKMDVDVRSNSRETKCPCASLFSSMNQTPGFFLFEA